MSKFVTKNKNLFKIKKSDWLCDFTWLSVDKKKRCMMIRKKWIITDKTSTKFTRDFPFLSRPFAQVYLIPLVGDRGVKEKIDEGVRGDGMATACEFPLEYTIWWLLAHGANNKFWSSFPSGDSTSTIAAILSFRCIINFRFVLLLFSCFFLSSGHTEFN